MDAKALDRAADENPRAYPRIVERLHTEMVARAEKLTGGCRPDRKGEISEQVIDALRGPLPECTKDQFGIRHDGRRRQTECAEKSRTIIEARICHDPCVAVERERLTNIAGHVTAAQ